MGSRGGELSGEAPGRLGNCVRRVVVVRMGVLEMGVGMLGRLGARVEKLGGEEEAETTDK